MLQLVWKEPGAFSRMALVFNNRILRRFHHLLCLYYWKFIADATSWILLPFDLCGSECAWRNCCYVSGHLVDKSNRLRIDSFPGWITSDKIHKSFYCDFCGYIFETTEGTEEVSHRTSYFLIFEMCSLWLCFWKHRGHRGGHTADKINENFSVCSLWLTFLKHEAKSSGNRLLL